MLIRYCIVLAAACSLPAAEHRGVVKFGSVPLPGATVSAAADGRKLTTITDQDGNYSFAALAEGTWKIRVEMLCFEPAEREIVAGPAAPALEWDLKLLPYEKILAMAKAAATTEAPAPRSAKGARPQPVNTPSDFQRAGLNASKEAPQAEADPPDPPGEFNQAPSDGFLINGSVNNGANTPFAQAAAFGNYRPGRRSLYNASLGLVFDNSFWNARAFSLTGQDTPKPSYTRAQGLLALGGPLRIPGLLPRGGPNVTLNYQWTRNRNATTSTARVPSAAERGGDFSQSPDAAGRPVLATDPDTGAPFAGNSVPASRIAPQARALLSLYPAANFQGGRYNYQLPLSGSTHQDDLQTRASKMIGARNSINGQFALQSMRSDNTSLFGFLDTTESSGINTSVNWFRRFTLRSFATLGVQFSRFSSRVTPYFAHRLNVSGEAGIAGNNQEPANWGPPALTFSSGIATLSDAQSSLTRNQTAGFSGSLFWVRGSHNLIAGGGFRRQQFNQLSQQDARGAFTFTGAAAGSDFAGFLLGIPDVAAIAFGNADKYFRALSYEGYFTDDWRARASFSLNAGLRWDYNSPITERYSRIVNLDSAPGFAISAPVVAANPTGPLTGERYPASLIRPYRRAIQPRIGASWRPILASSLVIRAGYGVYFDSSIYLPIATRMAQQPPLSKSLSLQNSAATPLTLANGFHLASGSAVNTFGADPNLRPGYSQNWQLSIQRDLPGSLVVTATYLGIKGTHTQQQFLPNTYPAGAPDPCPACTSGYVFLASNGNSTRQSGNIQLRRRLRSGFAAQLSYTFSKAIDNGAAAGSGQQAAVIAQDWRNLRAERGLSSFDQRHKVSVQMQFTSGMGLGGGTLLGGWQGGLFKDWTFATQINAGSGLPLTPVYMTAVSGTGITGVIRPDYTGAPLYDAPPGLFLNPAAVTAPAPGRWGNAGRNSITGPGQFTLNSSLARTFRLGDRLSADFRLDSTNTLNHVTFPSWNTLVTSSQFGLPTSANPMRSLQSTLRVRF
jgi:hypothetical protein